MMAIVTNTSKNQGGDDGDDDDDDGIGDNHGRWLRTAPLQLN